MFITTRFSTVLRHSVRDTADAFEQLGWQTHVLIEPDDHHRVTDLAMATAIHTYDPDLVFTLNVLRTHLNGVVPDGLPLVCWVQDHLPKLTSPGVGGTVSRNEFVLTTVAPMYTDIWGYPKRQIIETPKLTRVPQRPASWTSDGPDFCYVSNASQDPARLADATVRAQRDPALRRLTHACVRRMLERYEQGGSLATLGDIGRLLDEQAAPLGIDLSNAAKRSTLVNHLMHPLNNALYRQQVLGWVVELAERAGLSFELYGNGWDKHPRLAPYARGYIGYGAELEDLTRRARINLQIIPSFCLHQRLLDGLVAGGFFLVRSHPSDTLMPQLAAFLTEHAPDDAETVARVRAALDTGRLADFDALMQRARCLSDLGVPINLVTWVRSAIRSGVLVPPAPALPDLDAVSFEDAAGLRRLVERFHGDDSVRADIAARQRAWVEQRLTYAQGMRRVVERMTALLQSNSEAAAAA
jgi:hypothetical protein